MSLLGNILWLIFGGLLSGLGWILAGALWCVTIVGIPIGLQCFKLASLSFAPFGREVVEDYKGMETPEFKIKERLLYDVYGIRLNKPKYPCEPVE